MTCLVMWGEEILVLFKVKKKPSFFTGVVLSPPPLFSVPEERSLHEPNKYSTSCLAVADLLVCLFLAPLMANRAKQSTIRTNELHYVEIWKWLDIWILLLYYNYPTGCHAGPLHLLLYRTQVHYLTVYAIQWFMPFLTRHT